MIRFVVFMLAVVPPFAYPANKNTATIVITGTIQPTASATIASTGSVTVNTNDPTLQTTSTTTDGSTTTTTTISAP